MKKYLNRKGSALIFALAVLIILTAVGSAVVMLSTANITMSQKYSHWSAEYYNLDYAAEKRLAELDNEVLLPAENKARGYLQDRMYQCQWSDLPDEYDWVSDTDNLQTLIYDRWSSIVSEDEHDEEMAEFNEQVFDIMYWNYIDGTLGTLTEEADVNGISTKMTLNLSDHWYPDVPEYSVNSDDSDNSDDEIAAAFNSFSSAVDHLDQDRPRVDISAWDAVHKAVDVEVTVIPPSYNSVQETRYIPVKPNPLYTNALSVNGGITFKGSGNVTIVGDVVSNNQGESYGLKEGNDTGVKTGANVHVTVYGNIQSAGDVHLWGSNSSITVKQYKDYSSSYASDNTYLKQKLYGDDYDYFMSLDAAKVNETDNPKTYAEGDTDDIPFIYKDITGGNVECNNLAVESGVSGGAITVAGSVITQDDVQNDGKESTRIVIGDNYIGIRSDANESKKDPNGSSAVINNAYIYGGTITIGKSYIIPGTAWYKFGTEYYQTAESASAKAGEYFQIYQYNANDAINGDANFSTYSVSEYESYLLFNGSLNEKISRFTNAMSDTEYQSVESGIGLSSTASRYLLGVAVTVENDNTQLIKSEDSTNQTNYSIVSSGILPNSFLSKTQQYGTADYAFDQLTNSAYSASHNISQDGFYYLNDSSGRNMLDVSPDGIQSGIVYAVGDLTITGNGDTFRGSIICSGDVTVESGVKLVYDESVIKSVLGVDGVTSTNTLINADEEDSGSRLARRFFTPAGYSLGQSLATELVTTVSTGAGERELGDVMRYTINKWKETKN